VKEKIMHPLHGDETKRISRLTTIALALLLALVVGVTIKFDLWKVPEDESTAPLLESGAPQPVTTAQHAY
jgi:hypothetical protein